MPRAYWAPISCLAVVQGVSLRAVWNRQVHRIAGAGIGLGRAWALIAMPLDPWSIAVVFITPVTILLVEAATLGAEPAGAIIE